MNNSEGLRLTGLRERLDNVLAELAVIEDALDKCDNGPPCCLTLQKNGKIGCNIVKPLEKKQFYKKCEKCREQIRKFLDEVRLGN